MEPCTAGPPSFKIPRLSSAVTRPQQIDQAEVADHLLRLNSKGVEKGTKGKGKQEKQKKPSSSGPLPNRLRTPGVAALHQWVDRVFAKKFPQAVFITVGEDQTIRVTEDTTYAALRKHLDGATTFHLQARLQ